MQIQRRENWVKGQELYQESHTIWQHDHENKNHKLYFINFILIRGSVEQTILHFALRSLSEAKIIVQIHLLRHIWFVYSHILVVFVFHIYLLPSVCCWTFYISIHYLFIKSDRSIYYYAQFHHYTSFSNWIIQVCYGIMTKLFGQAISKLSFNQIDRNILHLDHSSYFVFHCFHP